MATIIIRNLDDDVVARIDQISKSKGYKSREEFLRINLRSLSVMSELKELDSKYNVLVKKCLEVISFNTEVLHQVMDLIDKE